MNIKYCEKCGSKISNTTDRFCAQCGNALPQCTAKTENFPDKVINTCKNPAIMKKLIPIFVVIALCIALCLTIAYRNSSDYLENKLRQGDWVYIWTFWYTDVEYRSTGIVKFYSDGVALLTYHDGSGKSYNWQILDDKTLVFDGTYYDYGEWYLSNGDLVIGDDFKCTKRPNKYPEYE